MRTPVILIAALALGLLTAFLTYSLLGGKMSASNDIVIAKDVIQPGIPIKPEQLSKISWAAAQLPQGAFTDFALVSGRISRRTIAAGELVLEQQLARPDAKGGMSAMITPGMRAISVRVDEVVGVAGFALPGAYVDVMVSVKDNQSQAFSKIVLERVKVLAAEQETSADPAKPKVVRAVTLELSPQDSEKLDLARAIGTLSLVLRNEFDTNTGASSGARMSDLLAKTSGSPVNDQSDAPSQAPLPSSRPSVSRRASTHDTIEQIRGTGQM